MRREAVQEERNRGAGGGGGTVARESSIDMVSKIDFCFNFQVDY